MNQSLEILQGELERLFTMNELITDICRELLGIDPEDLGGTNLGKAAFVRKLIHHCDRNRSIIALTDAVNLCKSGMVDPRLKQIYTSSVDLELEPGTRVGSFEIVEAAGEFSLGLVYRAKPYVAPPPKADGDETSDQADTKDAPDEPVKLVRLQVVSSSLTPDPRAVQRYKTALRAMKRIDTPNLPTILEVGELPDGRPWSAVEELTDTKTFFDLIQDGRKSLLEVWPVIEQVLTGLEALHKAGITHGDLKAENILVQLEAPDPDDEVEVVEAGTSFVGAKVLMIGVGSDRLFSRPSRDDSLAGPLTGAGTPRCMAPEQARGKPLDRRTDLYALGAMLYELLTGRTVFSGRTGIDMVARHLTEVPKPPSSIAPKGWISGELDELILALLAKDALRRPKDVPSVRKILQDLASAAQDAATEPEGSLEDAQAAADLFIEDPADPERADTLEAAAGAARAWSVAKDAYEITLDTEEGDEVIRSIKLRLARVLHIELEEFAAAEKIYQELLEKNPGDQEIEHKLEELKRQTGQFDDVIDILLGRIERTEDKAEKIAIFREVARIYVDEHDKPDQAFAVLLAALPTDQTEKLLAELEKLAGQTGQWNDLVQACSNIVQSVQEPTKVVLITTNMGLWYGEKLGRQDYALPCFQQALAIEPTSDNALKGMEEIFRRQQQWLELAQVLLSRAEVAKYPSDRRDRLAEAAAIFAERLSDDGRAVELYRSVLSDDPAHTQSVAALERIFVRTEAWNDLIQLYRSKAEALTDPTQKAETCYVIAETYEDRLANEEKAIESYASVLEIDEHHIPTLKGLERLYAKTGDFRALLENLKVQLDIAATPRQRVSLLLRRAQILEEEFVKREEALAEYQQLLEIEVSHEEALTAVARLQRTLEQWEELDETLATHIDATNSRDRKIQLLRDRASLQTERLDNPAEAAKVLKILSDLVADDMEILDQLAKQRLLANDFEGTIKALERLAKGTKADVDRANVWVRIGDLYERKLHNSDEAEAAYREALNADKNNVVAAAALQESYAEKGDMTAALNMLERQLEAASGDLERSRIYTQMGSVCHEKLNEPERAVEYYEKALKSDKSNSEAAEPLAELHRQARRWEEAVAIYDRFSDATSAMSKEKRIEFCSAWGQASLEFGDLTKAKKAFSIVLDEDPDNAQVSASLGDVHSRGERWSEAAAQYEKVLEKSADSFDDDRRADLYHNLGLALKHMGKLKTSGEALDKALDLQPENVKLLRHRADVHLEAKEYEKATTILELLAEATQDDTSKIAVLTEVGDIFSDELVEQEKAAKAYSAALAYSENDRNLLMRLMKAYNATEQWSNLVEVVLQIADLETDTVKMARYYQTAAVIAHQKLGRPEEAREYYEMAIDQDASLIMSFDALTQILTSKEEWDELEEAYKKMLKRLPKETDKGTWVKLYDALAGVLANQLDKPDEAIEFYEKAFELDRDDRPRKETLARLYSDTPKNAGKAISLHHQLLELNPFRTESYQALRKIYASTNQWDQQWCCARTLAALHMADEEEEALYKHFRTEEIPPPGDCLTDEHWQNYLLHKSQSRRITSIFETILPAVLKTQARPHKAFGVDPSTARNLDTDDHPFSGLVRFAAGTLGMEPPVVFFKEDQGATDFLIRTNPPAILAGTIALGAAYENPRALAFIVGRQLSYAKGGHFMRVLLESGTTMRAWLLAALKHVVPKIPVSSDMVGTVTSFGTKLSQNLGPVENETLRTHVMSFIDSAAKVDLKQWASAVDFTADRVGFLLCDDLELASKLVRADKATVVKERLKELNLFSVSPEYFTLRQKLLIQLRVEQ